MRKSDTITCDSVGCLHFREILLQSGQKFKRGIMKPRDSLPVGDIDVLRKLLAYFKEIKEKEGLGSKSMKSFFGLALVSHYDCMWEGLRAEAGHVIYRLSDQISPERRQTIPIYPYSEGSIRRPDGNWDSLEDWRKRWEECNSIIPKFQKLLPLIEEK